MWRRATKFEDLPFGDREVLVRAAEAGAFDGEFSAWMTAGVADKDARVEKEMDQRASALLGRSVDVGEGDLLWTQKDDGKDSPFWAAMAQRWRANQRR